MMPRAPLAAAALPEQARRATRFRAMFHREFGYVWTSLRRLGVHERDAEDVAQDVFVRVYGKLDDYDPTRPVRPWLFAFALRAASDWRRLARHRTEASIDPDHQPSPTMSAEEAVQRANERQLVLEALEHVEIDRRAVFVLYELDETPMKDIAEALGIPLFTAYSRLRLARREFADAARRIRAQRGERGEP
jgi:RNA polymerase sigma-70 factor (ECF subfamily)